MFPFPFPFLLPSPSRYLSTDRAAEHLNDKNQAKAIDDKSQFDENVTEIKSRLEYMESGANSAIELLRSKPEFFHKFYSELTKDGGSYTAALEAAQDGVADAALREELSFSLRSLMKTGWRETHKKSQDKATFLNDKLNELNEASQPKLQKVDSHWTNHENLAVYLLMRALRNEKVDGEKNSIYVDPWQYGPAIFKEDARIKADATTLPLRVNSKESEDVIGYLSDRNKMAEAKTKSYQKYLSEINSENLQKEDIWLASEVIDRAKFPAQDEQKIQQNANAFAVSILVALGASSSEASRAAPIICARSHKCKGHLCKVMASRSQSRQEFHARPNGLYKTELIHRRAPWKTKESVELTTLEWGSWFNHHRLLEPFGYIHLPRLRPTTIGDSLRRPMLRR